MRRNRAWELHLKNVKVKQHGNVRHVNLIDLDGFAAAGLPSPIAGALLYMPPELNKAVLSDRPVQLDETTDRFSLAILLNEVLICAHVGCAARNEEETSEALHGGKWLFGPVYGARQRASACRLRR